MMMRGLLGLVPTPAPVPQFENFNVRIRNRYQENLYQEWKNHVVNLLLVTQTGIDMRKLGQTLLNYGCGDGFVPVKQMGFETFGEFLYSFRDLFIVTHFPHQNPNDPMTRLFLFVNHNNTYNDMNRDVADVANLVQRQRRFQFDGNWNHPIITQVMLCHPLVVRDRFMPMPPRNLVWINPNLVAGGSSKVVEIKEIQSAPEVTKKDKEVAVQISPTLVTSPVSIPVAPSEKIHDGDEKIHDGDDKKDEKKVKTVDCGVNTSPQKQQDESEVDQGLDQNDGGNGDGTSLIRRSLFSRRHPHQNVSDLFYRLPVPDRYIRYVGPTSGSCTTCNQRLEMNKKKEEDIVTLATSEKEDADIKEGGSTGNRLIGSGSTSPSLDLQGLKISQEELEPKEAPAVDDMISYCRSDPIPSFRAFATSPPPVEGERIARVVIDPDFTVEDEENLMRSRIARQTFKRRLPSKRTTFNTGKNVSQVFLDTLFPESDFQYPIVSNDPSRPVVSSTPSNSKVPLGQKPEQVKRLNFHQL
ncbi:uncharacterized protein LOC110843686 isoform X2 [Folsomia candida]|uniref:uncharacterized protein LOC110843686 isoform X2 n=1 Tax=Folsomia candida TaxID=158441 RepID=UPI000B908E8A|nr:uncharacterized protein LOC110843686 isoform X2 [Folsomia candida]